MRLCLIEKEKRKEGERKERMERIGERKGGREGEYEKERHQTRGKDSFTEITMSDSVWLCCDETSLGLMWYWLQTD